MINSINQDIQKLAIEVDASSLQISILRMQTNPKNRIGFSTVSLNPEEDRKKMLDKSSVTWPRNRIKHFTNR